MATSQNGYIANNRGLINSYTIPGGKIALRKGDVATVLVYVATRFHNEVETLKWPGNWGYAERTIRGNSRTLSNHASGTAIDLNAPKHPLGKSGTFTAEQKKKILQILKDCDGVVRWGGSYSGRKDEMHFEINKGTKAVKALANKIKTGGKPKPSNSKKPATTKPSNGKLSVDKDLGPATAKRLQEFLNSKNKNKIKVDKKLGNSSFKALQIFLKAKYKDGIISSQATSAKYVGSAIVEGWENKGKASKGSPTVKLLQKWVGAKPDGFWGKETTGKLQSKLNSEKK